VSGGKDNQYHKLLRSQSYGNYCTLARKLGIKEIPFCDFTLEFWKEFKNSNKSSVKVGN